MRLLTSVERTLDQRLTSRLESHRCTARSQESRRELRFALKRPSWQNSALLQSDPTRFLDPSICLQCVRSTSCVAFLPSTQRCELFSAFVVFMVICVYCQRSNKPSVGVRSPVFNFVSQRNKVVHQ